MKKTKPKPSPFLLSVIKLTLHSSTTTIQAPGQSLKKNFKHSFRFSEIGDLLLLSWMGLKITHSTAMTTWTEGDSYTIRDSIARSLFYCTATPRERRAGFISWYILCTLKRVSVTGPHLVVPLMTLWTIWAETYCRFWTCRMTDAGLSRGIS